MEHRAPFFGFTPLRKAVERLDRENAERARTRAAEIRAAKPTDYCTNTVECGCTMFCQEIAVADWRRFRRI